MIRYRTRKNSFEIEAVEIARETAHHVFLPVPYSVSGQKREAKRSSWQQWHDTWEQAQEHLLSRSRRRLEVCRQQLEREQQEYRQIQKLKPPKQTKSQTTEKDQVRSS